jgi:hypothetical protein
LREIRLEKVAENLDLALIGVRRGPVHDELEATVGKLFRGIQNRDGVFSVSKSMTVGELLDLYPDWRWHLDSACSP